MDIREIVPASAPFTEAQRMWLNGFLSGWLGKSVEAADSEAEPAADADAVVHPWHDDTMPLDDRMALAEGRMLPEQLSATMGQQDCGQCGYLCNSYAAALAGGSESDTSLCVPGGRETRVMVKDLLSTYADQVGATSSDTAPAATEPGTRDHPVPARILAVDSITAEGSSKDIRHVAIDLSGSGLEYRAGDSLGVFVSNEPALVDRLLATLRLSGLEFYISKGQPISTREALFRAKDITKPSDELLELLHAHATEASRETLSGLLETGVDEGVDVLDLITAFPPRGCDPIALIDSLGTLQPRLYSISSSPEVHGPEVHTTVAVVRYDRDERERLGVASTYFADRSATDSWLPVYIQPTADFLLPEDGAKDMIMIGPGTGIAPFRAFLHERAARGDSGRNWLFFGNPNAATDFLYEEELLTLKDNGVLTELELAFSRDQAEKIYVQHRLLERGAEVWAWLEAGASIYVCGDATRMAVDVHQALLQIARDHGGLDENGAQAFIKGLVSEHRYLKDVY